MTDSPSSGDLKQKIVHLIDASFKPLMEMLKQADNPQTIELYGLIAKGILIEIQVREANLVQRILKNLPLEQQCIAHPDYDDDCTVCASVVATNQTIHRSIAIIERVAKEMQ